ncbi:DinB family protein [Pseudahrensia aquimaris]|uniref:DinB family protein n=1 Tax=Pseudahrensia aquimaris TaxID=744461 RepID=A0ABW3FDA7_9HYPH
MLETFRTFARYNGWANTLLYDAVAELDDAAFNSDCGLFFRDLAGTLNHLVVADQIWMRRFTGEGPTPTTLDGRPYPQFADLRTAREALDARIIKWTLRLNEAAVNSEFTYTPVTDPTPITQVMSATLSHFFNHQTHHRGQAHAALTQLTGKAPSMDLIYFQRHERLQDAS